MAVRMTREEWIDTLDLEAAADMVAFLAFDKSEVSLVDEMYQRLCVDDAHSIVGAAVGSDDSDDEGV